MKKKFSIIGLLFVFILTSGFGCKLVDQKTTAAMKPITIEYWRVLDGEDSFAEIIAGYNKLHPFVHINYKKFRLDEYETELLDAMAEDRGPDLFSIHNTWVQKYKNKIEPMPAAITMAYPVETGTIKKEIIPELRTTKSISLAQLKNNFVDSVFDDVVSPVDNPTTKQPEDKVLGLPLSMDTLALFYNHDLFNNAGIAKPPAFWDKELQQNVKRLTKVDVKGQIIQSGIALGGSRNIERSADVLALLMMQNGAQMSDNGYITFNIVPAVYKDQRYNPGLEALRFYSDFANPAKEVYTWSKDLNNSLDMFISGNLAMMLGYSYHLPAIKTRAPKLNLGIAPAPQIEGSASTLNFGNYWVETVSKKSKYTNEAWDFIQFAIKGENVKSYLAATKKPSALRALAAEEVDDPDIGVFASQILTSKSWYRGKNFSAVENIIYDMIDNAVLTPTDKLGEVLNNGARKAQQTIN
ncbi:MAG: extracellular solute-binding protein [Candidatus Falkowbacteria bacterium]|nr:extracellular solute-binding protein [Candidatus Falkowbacteria bacterium]